MKRWSALTVLGILCALLSFIGCKQEDGASVAKNEETSVETNEFPSKAKVEKAIATLNQALAYLSSGDNDKFQKAIRGASNSLRTKSVTKTYKAGIMAASPGTTDPGDFVNLDGAGVRMLPLDDKQLCFFGNYKSVQKLVGKDRPSKFSWGQHYLKNAREQRANNRVNLLRIDYKKGGPGRPKILDVPRCKLVKTQNIPPDSTPAVVKCHGIWRTDPENFYECSEMQFEGHDHCFGGNVREMADYLEEEFLFGSDENWIANARIINNNLIRYDAVDGPNNFRTNNLELPRCSSAPPGGSRRMTWETADQLSKDQLKLYLQREGYIRGEQHPMSALDDEDFVKSVLEYRGKSYDYIKVYSGDTQHGPLFKTQTTDLVGGNSDGDFFLYSEDRRPVWWE